ncbi:MAG: Dabb family protein [Bacteroidetes bacterium]|nr:Dabb family protein [Bacteroidota bacterium]
MKSFLLLFLTIFSLSIAFAKPKPLYKHAVTVIFKTNVTAEQIAEVDNSFKSLRKLKVVKGYEWGVVDDKKAVKHVYIFTFEKPEDLKVYAESPEHQAHIKVGAENVENVTAYQYFVK